MTDHFQKTVDIKTVDEENRTATGAVLVPNELDHQHDFLRPDAVERFHTDDVETGVMHSAFPEDAAALERSEVITESETIGDETFDAGTWVATRKYEDDELWQLVDDGVLQGFSIGGEIERAAPHDELPDDVTVPDSVEHPGDGGTELVDGTVKEVSDVDIPAVPRATYKGEDLGKSLLEEVDDEAEFVELMTEQRGHEEADARRLYQYLTDVREKAGDGKPGETFEECVEIIMEEQGVSEEEAREICGALDDKEKDHMSNSNDETDEPDDATKWQILKSIFGGSDDASGAEDLGGEKAGDDPDDEDDDEEDDEDDEMDNKDATGGETPDADMTDDDTTKSEEPPEWAKSLIDTVEENSKHIEDLAAQEKTAEVEVDGETVELSEKQVREAFDLDETSKALDNAPAWAQSLAEKVEDNAERIKTISQQSGHSTQLGGTEKSGSEPEDDAEKFKSQLVGGRTGGDA